jgi:hypothetical protein
MGDGGGDRTETVAALPRITRMRQRRFRLETIAQLVGADPPPTNQPPPQLLIGTG